MEDRVIINRAEYDLLVAKAYQQVFSTYTNYKGQKWISSTQNEAFEGLKAELEALEAKHVAESESRERASKREEDSLRETIKMKREEIGKLKDEILNIIGKADKDAELKYRKASLIEIIKWRRKK